MNTAALKAAIIALSKVYSDNEALLTELDSAIGDADHGINMKRGFTKVAEMLANESPDDIRSLLKSVSMTLIKTVGGASGPLYGTWFLKASLQSGGKTELNAEELYTVMNAGVQGLIALGKAELGDKTMVDAWLPALEAMKSHQDAGISAMLQAGRDAAKRGMESTIPLIARKGRASYLGERSKDHQDPGATSTYLLMETLADTLQGS